MSNSQEHKHKEETFLRLIDHPTMGFFSSIVEKVVNTVWSDEPIPRMTPKNIEDLQAVCRRIYGKFSESEYYPSPEEKAVHLLFSINKGHMLQNGNKRIALCVFMFFCNIYDLVPNFDPYGAYTLSKKLACAPKDDPFKGLDDPSIKEKLRIILFP